MCNRVERGRERHIRHLADRLAHRGESKRTREQAVVEARDGDLATTGLNAVLRLVSRVRG